MYACFSQVIHLYVNVHLSRFGTTLFYNALLKTSAVVKMSPFMSTVTTSSSDEVANEGAKEKKRERTFPLLQIKLIVDIARN